MRLLKFLFALFLLPVICCLLPSPARAQIPPGYVPCNETDDPEFHSLRPYQASSCNKSFNELSYICGNDLRVRDEIIVTPSQAQSCQISSAGATCHFNQPRDFWFSIDPYQSEFPIAGNTENVINSQSHIEELDDAQKVNEYVSWYLNGVTNRAEYGDTKNTDSEIVNFSGPIKKLLPSVIQEAQRIDTIQAAAATRHNQIAVCAQEELLGIWGKTKAHECYEGNNTAAKPDVYRLDSWDGDLSELRAILNLINPLDAWNKRIPPLPWDFESDILYRKAYNEWRGKSCLILPIIGLQCIDNPLIRNKWADLYPYIPLSSTEDRLGKLTGSDAIVEDSGGVEVADLETTWRDKNETGSGRHDPLTASESALYFAHMQENVELIDQLQSTYLGKNELQMAQVIGETTPPSIGSFCKIVDVRYNQGDQLFGEFIAADVTYTAIFDCSFPVRPIRDSAGNIIGYEPYGECTKAVIFASKIDVGTPKIDELWAKTVAGNASVFKRIFPKIGPQSAIDEIKDIPGVSSIVHDTDIKLLSTNPEIYFPHLGGILEYFLKGIQTMLRPKGYGESISFGPTPGPGVFASGSCPLVGENVYLLCSSFNGATGSGCHGSNLYWQSNGLCTDSWCQDYPGQTCCVNHYACRWQIPVLEGQQCYTNTYPDSVCYDPASICKPEAYGLAADFAYSGNLCGADAPVVLPEINGQQLNWEVVESFDFNCGGCAGGRLIANDGTNVYEIHMYHLNEGITSGGVSGQQVGTLYCFPAVVGHPHVHIELRINGEMVKPDNLCQ